jgi:HEAT repeat protein
MFSKLQRIVEMFVSNRTNYTSTPEPPISNSSFHNEVRGNVQQMIQIANVQGSVNLFSNELFDRIREIVSERGKETSNSIEMRKAVAQVLGTLQKKNALYAGLDNEIWKYVFTSLRELRDEIAEASATLHVDGPHSVKSLLDVMVIAIRDYLAKYEANYTRFVLTGYSESDHFTRERSWLKSNNAARDLLYLRSVLLAAIEPLNVYAEKGQEIHWEERDLRVRKYELARSEQQGPGGYITDTQTIASLIAALRDDNDIIRWTAVDALSKLNGPEAVRGLIIALKDVEEYVRVSARSALKAADPSSLMAAFHLTSLDMRLPIIEILCDMADAQTISFLAEAMRDNVPEIRSAAVRGLGKIGAHAVPTLIAALEDRKAARREIVETLGEIRDLRSVPILIKALKNSDPEIQIASARSLGQIGNISAIPDLIETLGDTDYSISKAAKYALFSIGRSAVPNLVEVMKSTEPRIRAAGAELLGSTDDERAMPVLIDAAGDKDPLVRKSVVEALGNLRSELAIPTLHQCLLDDDVNIRLAAVESFRLIKGAAAVSALQVALHDKDARVRTEAARRLGWLKDPVAVTALLHALNDEEATVRDSADEALKHFKKG